MSTEPPPPVNPYAPSEALAHAEARTDEQGQPVPRRRPSRAAAIVVSIITYPLAGVGLSLLARRSALAWVAASVCVYATMIAAVIAKLPAVFFVAFGLTGITWLAGIAYTSFATPGVAPPRATRAVLIAVLAFVAARAGMMAAQKWLIEGYQIPAGGMMPTLLVGDAIMIAKTKHVAPGDVVVFRYPLDRRLSYVKRAVAVGGQTVEVKDGVVWVDGASLKQWALVGDCPSSSDDRSTDVASCRLLQESAGKGWYSIMRDASRSLDSRPAVVPPGHVYVLGDNRDNSSDSRVWGPVPLDLVEGRPAFVWWSRDGDGTMRWQRYGKKID